MVLFIVSVKRVLAALLVLGSLSLTGCATTKVNVEALPPVLTQDELLRPYEKVATIRVHRNRYGSAEDLTPEDYTWAYYALRQEAGRIGADAVILPEVTIQRHTYLFYPTSHINAKGTAVKFR